MSVQNIQLKVQDIMQEYEEIAVQFYEDEEVLRAVAENVTGGGRFRCVPTELPYSRE